MTARAVLRAPGPAPRRAAPVRAAPRPVRPARKAGCACGGGCPACALREAAAAAAESAPLPDPGPGRPLEAGLRGAMEPRFGAAFASVRVHDGPQAAAAAEALGARAYAVGESVVFGAGAWSPGTPEGRRLIAHELTHVLQQRESGPALQRAPADFEIAGKFTLLASSAAIYYFEKGSSTLDAQEKQKIPGQLKKDGKDLILKGFRARDEARPLALARARAVEAAIKAIVPTVAVTVQDQGGSFQNHPGYRALRAVLPQKNQPQSAGSICRTGAEEIKPKCPDAAADMSKIFADAHTDLVIAHAFLRRHKDKTLILPDTDAKLSKYFRAGFNLDRVISDIGKIRDHLKALGARDMGRADNRPGYRCATRCAPDCAGAAAVSQGVGASNRVTFCPTVWDRPQSEASVTTVIHEASHGTGGIGRGGGGTDDVVYEKDKVMRFLTNAEALESADTFANFVQELVHVAPVQMLSGTRDDVSGVAKPANRPGVEEALARLAKWLSASYDLIQGAHAASVSAKASGWGASSQFPNVEKMAALFGLARPPARPSEGDIRAVAGIIDRVGLMSGVVNDQNIRVIDSPLPPRWTSAGSKAPALAPGTVVELNADALLLSGMADAVRSLLEAIVAGAPTIPAAHRPKYVALIEFARKRKNIGP